MRGSGAGPGIGATGAPGSIDGDAASKPTRVIELHPGQLVQAKVVELGKTPGEVTIGLLGGRVVALTRLALELGQVYDFTVTAVEPRVVLSAARPVVLPHAAAASAAGQLGVGSQEVAALLKLATDVLRAAGAADVERSSGPQVDGRALLADFDGRPPDGEQLRALHRLFGHDQEARVLRLAEHSGRLLSAERSALQHTFKAEALRVLDSSALAEVVDSVRENAARELVEGLSRIEVDNARRADHGSPTWLPLPASPETPWRDARMFVRWGQRDDSDSSAAADAQRSFSIVLLLDMTRLGPMRVDVGFRAGSVSVEFELADPESSVRLQAALEELRGELEQEGFEIVQLTVRRASARGLSIADLLTPPEPGDPRRLVDLHA